ncbi:UPF0259 family protein [Sodalis sp. CWE]|nr:UPF0259 family protein [Sodalis sp. CWE]
MLNFFRNQFTYVFSCVLLTSLASTALRYIFSPLYEQLVNIDIQSSAVNVNVINISFIQSVRQLSLEQQLILLKASLASFFSNLVGSALLIGGLLTVIHQISNYHIFDIRRVIILSVKIIPRLVLLIFLITLLVQFGLLLIIVPGIFLAIVFSLAPIISIRDSLGIIKSMHLSFYLVINNFRLLSPAILFWLLAKIIVLIFAMQFTLSQSLTGLFLLTGLSNLVSSLLLIYLYRLYMLLCPAK